MKTDTPETDAFLVRMSARKARWETTADWVGGHNETLEHARKMERERNALQAHNEIAKLQLSRLVAERDEARRMWSIHQDKLAGLREEVRFTLMENLYLADGDVCTLKRLKDAIGFDLDSSENIHGGDIIIDLFHIEDEEERQEFADILGIPVDDIPDDGLVTIHP